MSQSNIPLYHNLVKQADWTSIFHLLLTQKNIKWSDFYSEDGLSLIARASLDPNAMIIENLIKLGADPNYIVLKNQKILSPLWASIERNYIGNVNVLIRAKSDVNLISMEHKTSPLLYYTKENNADICNLLLDNDGDYLYFNSDNQDYDFYCLSGWIKNLSAYVSDDMLLLCQKLITLQDKFFPVSFNNINMNIVEYAYLYWKEHLKNPKYLYLYHLLESRYMRSDTGFMHTTSSLGINRI